MLMLIPVLVFCAACLAAIGVLDFRRARAGPGQEPAEPVRQSFLERWEQAAMQAGLPWRRSTYISFAVSGLFLATLLALIGYTVPAVLAAAAGVIGPLQYVQRLRASRAAQLTRQLPQALFLAGSVLRAGGTLLQAVDAVATELPAPLGEEFRRVLEQMLLGMPAHEAMAEAQARIGIGEFAAVVVAVRINAELGGNLAHIFDQIGRAIVDSQNAQRTITAFTTEGRMSANIIAALPFVVMGLMQLLSPGYFEPLFSTWAGRLILGGCVGAIFIGWRTVRRMVTVRPF
jgi:tight adherence protein B